MFRGVTCGLAAGVAGVEAGRGEPRPYEGNLCWRESGISVRDKKHMRHAPADELMRRLVAGARVEFSRPRT
jgi:hypothetical protein